jgi:hypothetical protein
MDLSASSLAFLPFASKTPINYYGHSAITVNLESNHFVSSGLIQWLTSPELFASVSFE